MIRRFIRIAYKFPSKTTGLTFEVDTQESAYLTQKLTEIIEELKLQKKNISHIEFLEFFE